MSCWLIQLENKVLIFHQKRIHILFSTKTVHPKRFMRKRVSFFWKKNKKKWQLSFKSDPTDEKLFQSVSKGTHHQHDLFFFILNHPIRFDPMLPSGIIPLFLYLGSRRACWARSPASLWTDWPRSAPLPSSAAGLTIFKGRRPFQFEQARRRLFAANSSALSSEPWRMHSISGWRWKHSSGYVSKIHRCLSKGL